jgi:hypothetical protein
MVDLKKKIADILKQPPRDKSDLPSIREVAENPTSENLERVSVGIVEAEIRAGSTKYKPIKVYPTE